jgi:hypothetical protein
MDTPDELRAKLADIAERSMAIKSVCANEESTKLYLILPVLGALGYDYTNPAEIQPEYAADFRDEMRERVDFVIMRDGNPAIAIECKKVGTDLSANRGQLRAYFTALQSVSLGILTDGIRFEFFTDCEASNIMDSEPFVTLDLEAATRSPIPDEVIEAMYAIARPRYQAETIVDAAEGLLLRKRARSLLLQEIREPSDEFCLHLMQRLGLRNLRRKSVQSRYGSLVRLAFEEALILPVLETLRTSSPREASEAVESGGSTKRKIVTTDRELAVYRYVCRRLAFLSADEHQFAAIDRVDYQDYVGKFAVYYSNVNKGRLFDFVAGDNGFDKFVFPEPFGEIITNAMTDIDEPLRAVFAQRVRELGAPKASEAKILQSA